MTIQKPHIIKFFAGLVLPLIIASLTLGGSYFFLKSAQEYADLQTIVDHQQKTDGLFGPALSNRTFHYKKTLFEQQTPPANIITIGSSRVLQFRGEDFKSPFVNMGGMSGFDEVQEMLQQIIPSENINTIILGIDFWWFNKDAPKPPAFKQNHDAPNPKVDDLLKPYGWFFTGKLGFKDIGNILGQNTPHIGMTAAVRQEGFDQYGSYHYTPTLIGTIKPDDPKFQSSIKRINNGEKVFTHGESIDETVWQDFLRLVAWVKSHDINLIVFMPPLAPQVIDAMADTGNYAYIDQLRHRLQETDIEYYDFHDLRFAGASDCEFIDGIHGGDIVFRRALMHMAARSQTGLAQGVKLSAIALTIQKRSGFASAHITHEVDFLDIGCDKTTPEQKEEK